MRAKLVAFALCLAAPAAFAQTRALAAPATATIQVLFSPNGGGAAAVASAIESARHSVRLASYQFTSVVVSRALQDAYKRGVDVQVVLDRSQANRRYSGATYLVNAGVPVRISTAYPVMHQKLLIVDDDVLGIGSMNFTKYGDTRNAENFNLIRGWPALTAVYSSEFERLRNEATAYRAGMVFDQGEAE